jgi:hypothetical protein
MFATSPPPRRSRRPASRCAPRPTNDLGLGEPLVLRRRHDRVDGASCAAASSRPSRSPSTGGRASASAGRPGGGAARRSRRTRRRPCTARRPSRTVLVVDRILARVALLGDPGLGLLDRRRPSRPRTAGRRRCARAARSRACARRCRAHVFLLRGPWPLRVAPRALLGGADDRRSPAGVSPATGAGKSVPSRGSRALRARVGSSCRPFASTTILRPSSALSGARRSRQLLEVGRRQSVLQLDHDRPLRRPRARSRARPRAARGACRRAGGRVDGSTSRSRR